MITYISSKGLHRSLSFELKGSKAVVSSGGEQTGFCGDCSAPDSGEVTFAEVAGLSGCLGGAMKPEQPDAGLELAVVPGCCCCWPAIA